MTKIKIISYPSSWLSLKQFCVDFFFFKEGITCWSTLYKAKNTVAFLSDDHLLRHCLPDANLLRLLGKWRATLTQFRIEIAPSLAQDGVNQREEVFDRNGTILDCCSNADYSVSFWKWNKQASSSASHEYVWVVVSNGRFMTFLPADSSNMAEQFRTWEIPLVLSYRQK